MPSTRRQLLATAGSALLGGCVGFDPFGSGRGDPPAPALTEPADWAHPEYDAGNTRSVPGYAAPDELGSDGWVAEFTEIEPTDVAGPVVADGIVYVAVSGIRRGQEAERLVALDARTGEERWRVSGAGSMTAKPPIVSGETVFWLSSDDGIRALHPSDGSARWTSGAANHSRLIPAHGLLLTGRGSVGNPSLAALDPRTGNRYWSRSNGERRWIPLAADDEAFYARLEGDDEERPDELHALDPATGDTRWSTPRASPRAATVRSGTVYCSTGRPDAQELLTFDGQDQEVRWNETHDLQFEQDDGSGLNAEQNVAAVTDDLLLLHYDFHGAMHGRIEARDPDTGDTRWTVEETGDEPVSHAPPVVAGDRVYLVQWQDSDGDEIDSTLRVLHRNRGDELARVDLPEPSDMPPVVAGGRLFLRTQPSHRSFGLRVLE
ncbi:outer membrane protein assembly factor BamB family protein [Haloarchaeobius baliensis]|uniref:outer membrane protein assembly factor BamB family protein n=1 Tax=Haloarchaeobius baliensis TaxID=1670458 RepID=UPI003F88521A